jgi:hypothetical protein
MLPLVLALLAPLAGKGADAGRASAAAPSYLWQVVRECPQGVLLMRAPLYPGRLGAFRDWGCALDYLDIDGRRLPFDDPSGEAMFSVPLEWAAGSRFFGACAGDGCEPVLAEIAAVHYPQSFVSVDAKFVAPPPAEKLRIERDREAIAAAFSSGTLGAPLPLWSGEFALPRPPVFTSMFGAERIISDKTKPKAEPQHTRHLGLDFDGETGEPITAVQSGVVVLAEPLFYSGGTVFINHGEGLFTTYFHMSEIKARVGQHVTAGTLLGLVGKTGRVTGPHLHFSAKWRGSYFDPQELFEWEGFDQVPVSD